MRKHLSVLMLLAALLVPWTMQAQGDTITSFPFTCNFEDATANAYWSISNSSPNGWYIGGATNNGGDSALYISDGSGTTNNYSGAACVSYAYLTFEVTTPGQYALQFDWKCAGESTYDFLRVAVAPATTTLPTSYSSWTATAVPSGFLAVDGGNKLNLNGTSWTTQTGVVSVSTAGVYCLVFAWRNDGSVYNQPPAAIDNVVVTELTCPQPLNLTGIPSVDEMELSWSAGGSETEWLVSVNDSAFFTSNDSSFIVTGLQGNTPYSFKVYAICGAGDTSLATAAIMRTSCVPISTLPYSYGFEGVGTGTAAEFPPCWNRLNDASNTSYNYYPYVSNTATYVHSGSNGLYWYHTTTTTYANNEFAILPPVDVNIYNISDLTLAFYAKTTSTSYHPQPIIGVMTNPSDATTFVPLDTLSATAITLDWQLFAISLADYTGDGAYIAIRWPRPSSACYMAIDDIYLTDTWCNMPEEVTASASLDEITISWEANGGSSFEVILGTDTIPGVTDTFYTFTNLTANTPYTYSVATECSDGNSMYVGGSIRTLCTFLDSLPYSYGFEDLATGSSTVRPEIPCWHHINNGTQYFGYPYVSSTSHNGSRSLYWYGSTTMGTYSDYQLVVLPGVDTNVYPINTLRLRFWARPSSASYSPVFKVGVMTDPNDASTFQQVAVVNVQNVTTWQEFSVVFGTFTGSGNFIAVRLDRPSSAFYAYTDDFTLDEAPSCAPVVSHHVTATAGSAYITWATDPNFANTPVSYEVNYGFTSDPTSATTVTTTDQELMLTGLSPDSAYTVSILASCSDSYSPLYTFNFSTSALPCLEWDTTGYGGPTDTLVVGSPGTSTTNVMPVNTGYSYSYCQHLILASEIATTGPTTFSGIGFDYAYSSPMTHANNCQIYMGNTTRSTFSVTAGSSTDSMFVPYSQLTLVYQGPINCVANGWNYFDFNQGVFAYDGTSNIVVAIVNNSGATNSSAIFRYQTLSGSAMSHRVYNNSTPYGPTEMDAARAGQSYWRSNMKLLTGGGECISQASCAAPAVIAMEDTVGNLELSWIPGYMETSWDVDYQVAGDSVWTNLLTGTSLTSYTILESSLQPNTHYTFRVTANCTDTNIAGTAIYTTPCGSISTLPFSEDFESYGSGSTVFPSCWYKLGSTADRPYIHGTTTYGHNNTHGLYFYAAASGYCYAIMPRVNSTLNLTTLQVSFWARQYSTSYNCDFEVGVMTDPTDATTFVALGTVHPAGTDYEAFEVSLAHYTGTGRYIAFRAVQHPGTSTAIYLMLDDVTLDVLPACPRVGNVVAENITINSATITWDTTSASTYEVQYGPMGFTLGSGTSAIVSGVDSLDITGLAANSAYNVYVRGFCSPDTSNWSYVVTFRTACGAIDTLPFSENFESYATGSSSTGNPFIPCWTRLNNGTSYGAYPYIGAATYNHTDGGQRGLYWYNTTTAGTYGDYEYVILPQIDTDALPINTLQLTFWAKSSSTSYYPVFEVGVMTSATDTAFQRIATINVGNNTEWAEFTTGFGAFTGYGSYVAIRALRPASTWTAYVDDITLDVIPACARVENLMATVVLLDSATVAWTDTSSTTTWYVEYDSVPFAPGTGHMTAIQVTDTFCVLSGLDSGTVYHVYVYPDCGTDIFERHITFTTLAASPATVPYFCDFEAAGVNGWDLINDGQNNYWIVGSATSNGGTQSLYVTDDGSSNSYSGAASYSFATRTFNLTDTGGYVCSFDWKCNGESSFDFIRVALVPAATSIVAGSYCGFDNTSAMPAGAIALDGGYRMNLQTSWQTQVAEFAIHTPGTYKLVFLWRNDGSVYNLPPAAIDNVTLMMNTCPQVENLTSTVSGTTYITINWTDVATPTAWQVRYGENGGTSSTLLTVTNHPVTITGLSPLTSYSFSVRPICSGTDTGSWCQSVVIATAICDGATEATNFDPGATATTSTYGPIGYSLYNYSYVQTIIDSADLASLGGDITAFSFNVGSYIANSSTMFNNMTVFMANVSESDLSSGFIHPDATHVFTKVIDSACFNYTESGWQTHAFDSAFTWDGHSNLLFAVKRDNGSYSGSQTFSAHTATASKMRYIYQDSGPYDINTVANGTASATVGDIRLISCSGAPCDAPVIMNTDTTETTITINWIGDAAGYEVAVVEGNIWVAPAAGTAVADTFYTFTGLTGETDYMIAVRAACGSSYSEWVYMPITTLRHPCAVPTGLAVTDNTYDGATVSWNAGENETEWALRVFCASPVYDHTYNVSNTPTFEVTGLDAGITYSVAVRALCDTNWFSVWSDTVALVTVTCPQVTNVGSSNITSTSATITWTSTGVDSYEIEYGGLGFPQGTGTTLTSATNSINLTGLEEETTYDVYVRSICATGVFSGWSAVHTFQTATQGIDDVEGSNVTLFPNPASTMVTIRGIEGESTVTVVDLNGREVFKTTADNTLTIDLDGYAKGAYFVRITGERTTAIRKLIVK